MVREAVRFNKTLVDRGQAIFQVASAEAIPCMDASFDRVIAINVIYFLADPVPALREVRRVLRHPASALLRASTRRRWSLLPTSSQSSGFTSATVQPSPHYTALPDLGTWKSGPMRKLLRDLTEPHGPDVIVWVTAPKP